MGLAVGRRERPAGAEVRAAVLERVAGAFEVLDAVVERNDAGDLLAQFPAGFASQQMRAIGKRCRGDIAHDFPFSARFADLAWDFGAEHDASPGAGFGAAVVLLVAR